MQIGHVHPGKAPKHLLGNNVVIMLWLTVQQLVNSTVHNASNDCATAHIYSFAWKVGREYIVPVPHRIPSETRKVDDSHTFWLPHNGNRNNCDGHKESWNCQWAQRGDRERGRESVCSRCCNKVQRKKESNHNLLPMKCLLAILGEIRLAFDLKWDGTMGTYTIHTQISSFKIWELSYSGEMLIFAFWATVFKI